MLAQVVRAPNGARVRGKQTCPARRLLEPATFGVTGVQNSMESTIVASFSVAETALKGRKVATPKPGRRPRLTRTDALASGRALYHWPLAHTSISSMLSG